MISIPVVFFFVFTVFLLWYWTREKKGQREIPGPKGLPLVGNTFQVGKLPYLQFNKWAETYGDIYKVKLGNATFLIVSDPKMVKEMFQKEEFSGRQAIKGFDLYLDETLGILNTEGELWEVHRRFLLRQLRDFGFGKSAMESLILEEVAEVIRRFKETEGKPVDNLKETLMLAVLNSLWTVVSGQRFQHDDPKLTQLMVNTGKAVKDVFENGIILILFPWMRHVMPEKSGYNAFRRTIDGNRKWFEEGLEEHKATFQDDNIRDFIDVYLAEVKKTTDPNSVFYGAKAERQLIATIGDLFFAGSDTTSATLAWAFLYLCKNPEVQKKFQDEITAISGNTRYISIGDRPNMPYSLALLDEILRQSSIVPTGIQHRATVSKEFQGYYIPKDTLIMPNMYFMHHNAKVWGDPENFRPSRFLTADGKYQKNEYLVPFQIGRRQCVGETLARDTLFIFLTNIFQRFSVSFDPNSPEPGCEPEPNFLLNPKQFSVIMTDRQ